MNEQLEKIKKERKEIINSYSSEAIKDTLLEKIVKDKKNNQEVIVKEIIEETKDTKSFILMSKDNSPLCSFLPGQYISINLDINDIHTSRAYSLSSTPKEALKGIYRITIKRVENGLVSNYMLDEVKVRDEFLISKPMGNFVYNSIKDEENVIAIAGGSGVTPFVSMAKSIIEGSLNFDLTVFYSVKTKDDIIFEKELLEINKKSKRVKFIITLTREEDKQYLHGHINEEMLKPYIKEFNTIFMCGPSSLYQAMNSVLNYFHIPRKNVYYESFFTSFMPEEEEEYLLTIKSRDKELTCSCKSDETILVSMEKAGIKAPALCRVGECGFCRSILLEGKIKMIGGVLVKASRLHDYIHPCISYPQSDIVIKLEV